jgi:hypothetical protein
MDEGKRTKKGAVAHFVGQDTHTHTHTQSHAYIHTKTHTTSVWDCTSTSNYI